MECPACGRINPGNAGKYVHCETQLTDAAPMVITSAGDAESPAAGVLPAQSDPSEAPTASGPSAQLHDEAVESSRR